MALPKKDTQTIVVKVGSNVLTRSDGKLDVTRMSSLVDQIAWLRQHGYEIILVSSGSVASGRSLVKAGKALGSVEQRQLYSAVGQAKLISIYYDLFREHKIHVGQILTMKESFATRQEYLNQRSCMEVMLQNGVLPIVNENDTVSITELMFTDNDELSGLIASMMQATTLVILSNVDGVYNSDNKVIPTVSSGEDISRYIKQGKSTLGRGGMITKCAIASKIADEGIKVIIANGKQDNILVELVKNPDKTVHTTFLPNTDNVSPVKKWLAHSSSFAKGIVTINEKAAKALMGKEATSLLLVGVTKVEGSFEEGDIVNIFDENGRKIALGRSSYSAEEAQRHLGEHNIKPLVHYDYMYMENE